MSLRIRQDCPNHDSVPLLKVVPLGLSRATASALGYCSVWHHRHAITDTVNDGVVSNRTRFGPCRSDALMLCTCHRWAKEKLCHTLRRGFLTVACMDPVWTLYGPCMDPVWTLCGFCHCRTLTLSLIMSLRIRQDCPNHDSVPLLKVVPLGLSRATASALGYCSVWHHRHAITDTVNDGVVSNRTRFGPCRSDALMLCTCHRWAKEKLCHTLRRGFLTVACMDPVWTLYGPGLDPVWTRYGPGMDPGILDS